MAFVGQGILDEIEFLARSMEARLVHIRRDFHSYAEKGWMEFRTASKLAHALDELGFQVDVGPKVIDSDSRMGVPDEEELETSYARAMRQGAIEKYASLMRGGVTGVMGTLSVGSSSPVVAMRFDIDANWGEEARDESHRPYREGFSSVNAGAMHSCGHDGHAAMGVGAAEIISKLRNSLSGKVKIIFQPAEEGARGALSVVRAGALDDVDYFLSPHIGVRALKTGKIICGSKTFQATTKYDAHFKGIGAHAGLEPEKGRNALLAAATATVNLHGISRHGDGQTRINVGLMQGGEGRNMIPASATIKLETRGATDELDAYMSKRALEIIRASAQMHDVEVDIVKVGQTITADSDEQLIKIIEGIAARIDGVTEIVKSEVFGAGDDATFMMRRVQQRGGLAAFLTMGAELKGGHHTPYFDFDEKAILIGTKVFAAAAINLCRADLPG